MSIVKKYIPRFLVLLFLISFSSTTLFGQLSDREKAQWIILSIAENTIWTNEANFQSYKIGVYGYSGVYNELNKQAKKTTIKGKPITIVQCRKIKDILQTQILYVPKNQIENLQKILENLPMNTLLITDECPAPVYMINFLGRNSGQKKIDIISRKARAAGIKFTDKLIEKAGSAKDLKRLYSKTENRLEKQKLALEEQQEEFRRKEKELQQLKATNIQQLKRLEEQKITFNKQKKDIAQKSLKIAEQKMHMDSVEEDLEKQKQKMYYGNKVLAQQKKKMEVQMAEVQKAKKRIDSLNVVFEENESILADKDSLIKEGDSQIKFQRFVMIGFSVLLVFILVLAFFIWRGYKVKQRINDELRDKNIAINKQKEELFSQKEQTELLNKELEKLSIVAAQTDNAVTIMDKDGNFEWVNVGYTRMYGYTLQLLHNERGENLLEASTEDRIKEIFEKCKAEKKTMVYETLNKTRAGKDLWVQISLTPILSNEGEVNKLITIGTNINKIKEAEREIQEQHTRILNISHKLAETNKELEMLSLVASETDNAISIMDAAGNFQWVNEGYSRLYGYTYNQLISEYSRNIITDGMNPEVKNLIKSCIEKQVPISYENHRSVRSGEKIWVQTTLTPITDKEGNPRNIISISQDISKLKGAEQAIRQLSEELKAQHDELMIQKEHIEQINDNIVASISYAKTIQSAILPPTPDLNTEFETFIIYRPKDIVSGDFYWHSHQHSKNGGKGKHYIAAVDCTGHGVPGAFMSMIGSRLLNEIVKEKRIDKPSEILELMNSQIKKVLRQEENENNDGMDICLCSIEHVTNGTSKVVFSGAKRPLYVYKQSGSELKHIKGTRKSIGGTQAKRNIERFADHEILLEKGDYIYLTTDGIIDQPSQDRIRFGSVRFADLLKSIGNLPLEVQKQSVEEAINDYQGEEAQRDDVTFLGIKV